MTTEEWNEIPQFKSDVTMGKIPTAEKILAKRILKFPEEKDTHKFSMTDESIKKNVYKSMQEFAQLHVQAALKAQRDVITEAWNKRPTEANIEKVNDWLNIDMMAIIDDMHADVTVNYPLNQIQ